MAASFNVSKSQSKRNVHQSELVWRNIILLSILHILGFYSAYLIFTEAMWKTIIFAIIYGVNAGIGITAGAHRLWCHRSYKAKLPLRILLAALDCMAMQTPIYEWCRDHRLHHKFTETDADPHNSKRGFFFSHVGWLFLRKHPLVLEKGKTVEVDDLMADPVVRYQREYYIPLIFFFGFYLPIYVPMKFWGESFLCSLFIPSIGRYVVLLHFTWLVNSAAHLYGYRPYSKRINARENWLVSFLVVGEGFHNFHHTFPWDYSIGEMGRFLNLGTIFIDAMALLGLAYDLKSTSPDIVKNVKEKNRLNECSLSE